MKYAAFIFILSCFLNSCLKAKCDGDCVTTTFKGRIYDATTNKGFDRIKVRAIWSNQSQDYLYPEVDIDRTNSSGIFELKAKINHFYFNSKTLHIQFDAPSGYELTGNFDGLLFFSTVSFYDYDASAFNKIDFKLYPVTEAKIKLVRMQTDSLKTLHLSFNFNNEKAIPFAYILNNFSQNYEYTIKTTADIYTRIKLVKTLASGTIITTYDSAIFRRNQNNILQINY
ncbi:MAG: hypothetical protein K2Q24_01870 [Chitinophagaceae bacterium]|nr:hypothetical protein [Chitinophagaceae bacterium]